MKKTIFHRVFLPLCTVLAFLFFATSALACDTIEVSTWEELKGALVQSQNNEVITLTQDITEKGYAEVDIDIEIDIDDFSTTVQAAVGVPGSCTLNLNGYTLTLNLMPANAQECAGIVVLPGGNLHVMDGHLEVNGEYALMNIGGYLTTSGHLFVNGYNTALLDYGEAMTEVFSGAFSGRKVAGYHNLGLHARIHCGSFEGARYGYLGGPFPKMVHIMAGGFNAFGYSLYNEGSDPLVHYFEPDSVLEVNEEILEIDDSVYAIEGTALIYKDPTVAPDPNGEDIFKKVFFAIGQQHFQIITRGEMQHSEMDVAPYINPATNRTMLPVRFVGEALGMWVSFNEETKAIYLAEEGMVLQLALNSTLVMRNEDLLHLESPPVVIEGRTMLPIGEIAELIGLSRVDPYDPAGYLEWCAEDQSIYIQKPFYEVFD